MSDLNVSKIPKQNARTKWQNEMSEQNARTKCHNKMSLQMLETSNYAIVNL